MKKEITLTFTRPEDEIIFFCTRQYPNTQVAERTFKLLTNEMNWPYLAWRAYQQGIGSLVYWQFSREFKNIVPETTLSILRDIYRGTFAHNAMEAMGIHKTMEDLTKSGIFAVPYRGSILAIVINDDLALRQNTKNQPGILIDENNIANAKETLALFGYNYNENNGAIYINNERGAPVKMTWSLSSPGYPLKLEKQGLWERLTPITIFPGKETVTLCAEDLLLTLCLQGTKHGWDKLQFIADVANLLDRIESLDWDLVLKLARILSCQRMLFTSLILVNNLLGVDLPNNVIDRAWADPAAESLARQVAGSIMKLKQNKTNDRHNFQLRSIQTLRGKIFFELHKLQDIIHAKRWKAIEGMKNSHAPKVHYEPTLSGVVDQMLTLAEVGPDDLVYDLGCGDGRIVVAAARDYGARGVGFDIDPQRIAESKARASAAGVEHMVTFIQQDAAEADLSPATVVTLYMGSSWSEMISTKLRNQLKPGSRVVSHNSDFSTWPPNQMKFVTSNRKEMRPLFLWRIE